jgi:hypothetical protein
MGTRRGVAAEKLSHFFPLLGRQKGHVREYNIIGKTSSAAYSKMRMRRTK